MTTKTATKKIDDLSAETKKTVEENIEKVTNEFKDVAQFGQDNLDAVVASSKIAAKALENINAELVAYTKKSYEEGVASAKQLSACKSPTDFFEKQTEIAHGAFEGFVAEVARLNDMYTSAAKDVFTPLNARFSAASDVMKSFRV